MTVTLSGPEATKFRALKPHSAQQSRLTRRGWAASLASVLLLLSSCSSPPEGGPAPEPSPSASTSTPALPAISLGGDAYSVVYGFGAAWVQVDPPVDAVVRIDAASGEITQSRKAGTGAAIAEDAVWMAVAGERLQKISPRSGKVLMTVKIPESYYVSVGAGSIWLPSPGGITRVDPRSGAVKKIPIASVEEITDLHATKNAVWATDKVGGRVFRVDQRTNKVVKVIRTGAGAHDLTVDRHGVWITNYEANTVSRIDPATNKVSATVSEVGSGVGIVACQGGIWTSVRYQGVFRIDPATNKARLVVPLNEWNYGRGCGDGELWITSTSGQVHRMAF